jgi:hypothetical protein
MNKIGQELEKRKNYLLKVKEEKEKALKKAPEGSLRINKRGESMQYYYRTDPKDFNGVYLKKKENNLVKKLAQKDYDKQVYSAAIQELEAIEKYMKKIPERMIEEIYGDMRKERMNLINPIEVPIEEYIRIWQQRLYEGKGFEEEAPEIYTAKGERVRSKSEVIIADMLEREGIPYRYECPLMLKGWGIVYPDFTLLHKETRKEIYWEHFGMMDNPEYAENAVQKIALYEQNGIYPGDGLIITYETKKTPIHRKAIFRMIERCLKS